MNLRPVELEHGERYGKLTVLRKLPSGKYRVGCACGYSGMKLRAGALMKGRVTACRKCSSASCAKSNA